VTLLKLRPRDIVRTKEPVFSSLKLDLDDDDAVLQALAAHPVLLERPIVVHGKKAAIGRPPENIRKIF
jgi:arsenate reductase